MNNKVESYLNILNMKDSGIKIKFDDVSDDQICHFCIDEDLIDEEIAYLYRVSVDDVRSRRHKAYSNKIHLLQEKLLQYHFVVLDKERLNNDLEEIKSNKTKEILEKMQELSNSELDELLDYIIINNKRLSKTILK